MNPTPVFTFNLIDLVELIGVFAVVFGFYWKMDKRVSIIEIGNKVKDGQYKTIIEKLDNLSTAVSHLEGAAKGGTAK